MPNRVTIANDVEYIVIHYCQLHFLFNLIDGIHGADPVITFLISPGIWFDCRRWRGSIAVLNGRWMNTGIAAMALALGTGCHHDVKTGAESVNLWANKMFEKCFDLALGETLVYRFNANESVLFNIHYHQGEEVNHVVPEHRIARSKGTLDPHISARYCLMWTNPNTHTAKVEYDYTIR